MFSIIIPSYNNCKYLELCIKSIINNSKYNHQIIVHVNVGSDGTIDLLEKKKIDYTYTTYNAGICEGMNMAAKKSTYDYILYAHDDFYFCPNWDQIMLNEKKNINHNNFYISGTMIETSGKNSLDCGDNLDNFNERKLLSNYKNLNFDDYQGSTWAPHLIHKKLWDRVGGFSEEFYPGTGSDPDLNMKLWKQNVRIFKRLGKCLVFHFGSTVTRRDNKDKNIITESGSKGNKIFLLKWGITIKFFRKYYLKSESIYKDQLDEPKKDLLFLIGLLKCKINYIYVKYIYNFNDKIKLVSK
jgi:glycosyltransferase involved in cell wall biosynthesis